MSTKSTYLHGKTFHYYYDHKDCDFHLIIKTKKENKEIKLPKEFILELNDLCMLKDNIIAIKRLTIKENEE